MFQCQSENSNNDSKVLHESNGDYEHTAARKPNSDRSDKKRSEFVAEIQAMIDPTKSNRYIARDINVSELLIKQVVHEDIRFSS